MCLLLWPWGRYERAASVSASWPGGGAAECIATLKRVSSKVRCGAEYLSLSMTIYAMATAHVRNIESAMETRASFHEELAEEPYLSLNNPTPFPCLEQLSAPCVPPLPSLTRTLRRWRTCTSTPCHSLRWHQGELDSLSHRPC